MADEARARLYAAGFVEPLEAELFDQELELRGVEPSRLQVRLNAYQLEITGAPPALQTHLLAAILLDAAGAFRLTAVEIAFSLTMEAGRGRPLELIQLAFTPVEPGGEHLLDRRFSLSWEWATATTGYSLHLADTEDRQLFLGFKGRVGHMALDELQTGAWLNEQAQRFDGVVARVVQQLNWDL